MGCLIHLGTLLTGEKIPPASPCLFRAGQRGVTASEADKLAEVTVQRREATIIIPNSWFAKQLRAE